MGWAWRGRGVEVECGVGWLGRGDSAEGVTAPTPLRQRFINIKGGRAIALCIGDSL